MADSFSLSAEQLDELFVQEVAGVVKLVGRLSAKSKLMPICTRWLGIFQQSTAEERFARNSLLLLLHKQLNDRSTLGYPFTDPNCIEMDLRTLHLIILSMDEKESSSSVAEEVEESSVADESSLQDELYSPSPSSSNLKIANQDLVDTNKALTGDLQELRRQSEKLQAQLEKLEKSNQVHVEQIDMLDKEHCYLKRIFACASVKALKQLCTGHDPAEFFVTLYSVLCEDESDFKQVKLLGEHFKDLLEDQIVHYQRQQRASLLELASRKYDTLRAKASRRYKDVVDMKLDAEEKEIILCAMRNLTVLRKLFLATFKGKASTKQAVLRFLQLSYEQMAEMLKEGGLPGNKTFALQHVLQIKDLI